MGARRGSAYVLVLGTSMLVTIIGIAAIMAVRVENRAHASADDVTAARLRAESAVQAALLHFEVEPSWRDTLAHDTWQPQTSMQGGTFSWKVVDETHGDLTTDRATPVRVHGRGTFSNATWTCSVSVQPSLASVPVNGLSNGDIERGKLAPWEAIGVCTLNIGSIGPHGGTAYLGVSSRTSGSLVGQSLSGLASGTTVQSSLWIRAAKAPSQAWVGLQVRSDAGSAYFELARVQVGTTWTQVSGAVTPTWSGAAAEITWVVGAELDVSFDLDDAVVRWSPPAIGPLPGTWRRETS